MRCHFHANAAPRGGTLLPLWLIAGALAMLALAGRPAAAQCPPDACATANAALWVGDLNNDNAVDEEDIIVLQRCFLPGGIGSGAVYCEAADFNFDGEINDVDLNYLNRIVEMAKQAAIKKLPRVQFSEIRVRKPIVQTNPAVPQSRYVEIRTPIAAASTNITDPPTAIQSPTVNGVIPGNDAVRVFGPGWYYLKVLRGVETANPTQSVRGMIAVVVPLNGMTWVANPLATVTRGLSLVVDGSFAGSPAATAVPPSVAPYTFDISPAAMSVPASAGAYTFAEEPSTNVTHLIVFRSPTGPRAAPAVGQRINVPPNIDPATNCDIAWLVPGTPEVLPPFDAIVDCVTIVRGTNEDTFGCIYGGGLSFRIGPVAGVGFIYAPPHIYRCRTAGTWTRGPDSVTPTSDSPFARNPTCTTAIVGCGEPGPDGQPRSCFEAQTTRGCSDPDCCLAVCQVDPSCCSVVWDASCAAQAQQTCTQCGLNPASCYVAHPTPSCRDSECCAYVCSIDPTCCSVQWSESCAHLAIKGCLSCGSTETGACDQVHPNPYCTDTACCTAVCNIDPYCCEVTWDSVCVSVAATACSGCGSLNAGSCCVVHPSPYCSNSACCAAVCALDAFCCATSWDLACTQLATVYCPNLNCTCGTGGSCQTSQTTPGCADSFCCQTVCLHDPYCCFVRWDNACVRVAQDLCTTNPGCVDPINGLPVLGSCYVPHLTPGCDQPGCCSQVCALPGYAYCCQTSWDLSCAMQAADICDKCGDPLAGSCYQAHGTPNCANAACCDIVCNLDPFCCSETWDGLCVTAAQAACAAPIAACGTAVTRSCFIPSYLPGCRTASCCTTICSRIDPFCCEVRWDAVCSKEATYFCTTTFPVTVGAGGCLTPHATPGCASLDCARAVCSLRPSCCSTAWDATCVTIAAAVCVTPDVCPATGDCFLPHQNGGCEDSACCSAVCAADPTCCDGTWDAGCAQLARSLCKTPAGAHWPCPCIGECSEAHDNPGCADRSCCNIVCNADPSCCEVTWDAQCAGFARLFCCGTPGCGSGCNKPCLVPHQEPYCSDPYCCDAVCRADPLCCTNSWDSLCVAGAFERCSGACGIPTAGNCFIEHDQGGCRDGRCCAMVCTLDPTCCTTAWDSVCVDLANQPAQASACKRTQCGTTAAGPCCVPHDSQGCNNLACCTAVCAADPYCCDTEWDANCTDEARDTPACGCTFQCGDPCAGDCCRAHANNSCDDAACCAAVCASDSYCCEVEWDSVCAATARATCTGRNEACPVPPCGSPLLPSCCVPGLLPNCGKLACCNAICAVDPFCCQIQWDTACAQRAREPAYTAQCGCQDGGCGDPGAGSCFTTRTEPYCNDLGCCQTVCAFDALCCTIAWDANCVSIAEFFCGSGFAPLLEMMGGSTPDDSAGRGRMPPQGWIPPRLRAEPRIKLDAPVPAPGGKRPDSPGLPGSTGVPGVPGAPGAPGVPGSPGSATPGGPPPGKSVAPAGEAPPAKAAPPGAVQNSKKN
jgi:hypothetical protein